VFRPNDTNRKSPEQTHADPRPFFGKAQKGLTEEELRRDAWKWENTLHAAVPMRGSCLRNPAFDIHYNSRMDGHNHKHAQPLKYALVISMKAIRVADLYDQVLRRYARQLEPLRPVIEIPLKI
jgi:CRISPR/Cas system-associated exonuclease Cas4 (RecB family)